MYALGAGAIVCFKDAALLEGVDIRTIRRRHPTRVPLPLKRPNGRRVFGIRVADLSPAAQGRYAEQNGLPVPADAQLPANAPGPPVRGLPATLRGMPDWAGMRYIGLERIADEGLRRTCACADAELALADCPRGQKRQRLGQVAEAYGTTRRSLQRWCKDLAEGGPWALVPQWGAKTRGLHPNVSERIRLAILRGDLDDQRLDAWQIKREIIDPLCDREGIASKPSLRTIEGIVNETPKQVRDFARQGMRYWQTHHEPRVRRIVTPEALEIGAWLVGDHRRSNTQVFVADGAGAGWGRWKALECRCGSGKPRRECCSARHVYWTMWVEPASGGILGLRVSVQPNASVICLALRDALMHFVPEVIQTDRGWDFAAAQLQAEPVDFANPSRRDLARAGERWPTGDLAGVLDLPALVALGVKKTQTLPYYSWSKIIESIFYAFSRRFRNALPGDTGRSPDDRPAEKLADELREGHLLSLEEYVGILREQVRLYNVSRPVGERDRPPAEILADCKRPTVSPEALTFLLQENHQVEIKHGKISLKVRGETYEYTNEAVANASGEQVEVRIDPEDRARAYVRFATGQCVEVLEFRPAEYGAFSESNLTAKRLARGMKDVQKAYAMATHGAVPVDLVDFTHAHRKVNERLRLVDVEASRRRAEQTKAADRATRRIASIASGKKRERLQAAEREAPSYRQLTVQEMRDWAKRVISGLEHTHYWGAYDEVQEIGDEHVRGIIAELVHVVKEVPGSQLCNARGAPRIRPLLARLRLPEFTEEMRESGPAYWLLERAGLVPLVHPVEYRWSRLAEEEGEAIEDTAPIPEPEPEAPPIPEADRELLAEIVADLRQIEDMSADGSANAGGIHAVVYGLQVRADDLTNPAAWSELHPADRVALEGCGIVPAVVRRAQRQAGRAAGAVA